MTLVRWHDPPCVRGCGSGACCCVVRARRRAQPLEWLRPAKIGGETTSCVLWCTGDTTYTLTMNGVKYVANADYECTGGINVRRETRRRAAR